MNHETREAEGRAGGLKGAIQKTTGGRHCKEGATTIVERVQVEAKHSVEGDVSK